MTELLYMLGFEAQRMSQPGELALDKAMRINEEAKEELTFCLNMAKQSHNTLMVNKLTKILNSLS